MYLSGPRLVAAAAATLLSIGLTVGAAGSASASGFDLDITSATHLDPGNETVTLPLQQGTHAGQRIYYVVTDDSDQADAARRGVNWAPKLRNALGTAAVENASLVGGVVEFPGIVDFGPARSVISGPDGNEFLGGTYRAGAVGDQFYSPLITTGNGIVLNATQVADDSGVHDSVVGTFTPASGTVTLKTFFGFWNGHTTIYLHQDASTMEVAAAERSIFAPNLNAAPGVGSNDPNTSSRSAIIPAVNGATGTTNPQRQGLNSAIRGEGDPFNVNQEVPGQGNGRYSPVWDVTPVVWTQAAINAGQRVKLTSAGDVANAFSKGWLVGGGAGPANASLKGVPAGNLVSNCPIVAFN